MRTQTRVPELDGLRGIAVLLVVLFHSSFMLEMFPQRFVVKLLEWLVWPGWLGVDVFFVLSGFLITGILLSDRGDWKRFYCDRAFRILPPFLVVFAVTLSLSQSHPWLQVLAYLLFVGNFAAFAQSALGPLIHLWSLAVEEQFYVLWPQAAWRVSKPALLKIALSLCGASMVCRCVAAAAGINTTVIYWATPTHLDGIALGCAVAIALQIPPARAWLAMRWRAMAWTAVGVLAAGAAFLREPLIVDDIKVLLFAIPAASVLTASVVFAAVEHKLPLIPGAALRNRLLIYFGKRSYALYLIHWPMIAGLDAVRAKCTWAPLKIHGARTLVASEILAIVLSMLLAELSWRMVEQPAQRLKRRWFEDRAEITAARYA